MNREKKDCNKCGYSRGQKGMCYRITAPHTPQWLNENGNCKDFIRRWSLKHFWCLFISNI